MGVVNQSQAMVALPQGKKAGTNFTGD